jgi:hypothetical protein
MSKKIEKRKETHKKLDWSALGIIKSGRDKSGKHDDKQLPKEFYMAHQKVKELREHIEDLVKHGKYYIKSLQGSYIKKI